MTKEFYGSIFVIIGTNIVRDREDELKLYLS